MSKSYHETIIEMGVSERRQVASRLLVLVQHIAKTNYVTDPVKYENELGWTRTIREQRTGLEKVLMNHRSLIPEVTQQSIDDLYTAGIGEVRAQYPSVRFPEKCPFTLKKVLGEQLSAMLEA